MRPGLCAYWGIDAAFAANVDEDFAAFFPMEQVVGKSDSFAGVAITAIAKIKHDPSVAMAEDGGVGREDIVELSGLAVGKNGIERGAIPMNQVARDGDAGLLDPAAALVVLRVVEQIIEAVVFHQP